MAHTPSLPDVPHPLQQFEHCCPEGGPGAGVGQGGAGVGADLGLGINTKGLAICPWFIQ